MPLSSTRTETSSVYSQDDKTLAGFGEGLFVSCLAPRAERLHRRLQAERLLG